MNVLPFYKMELGEHEKIKVACGVTGFSLGLLYTLFNCLKNFNMAVQRWSPCCFPFLSRNFKARKRYLDHEAFFLYWEYRNAFLCCLTQANGFSRETSYPDQASHRSGQSICPLEPWVSFSHQRGLVLDST